MSRETKAQKDKKNNNRVPVKDRAFFPSMQRNYSKPVKKEETNQSSLF